MEKPAYVGAVLANISALAASPMTPALALLAAALAAYWLIVVVWLKQPWSYDGDG